MINSELESRAWQLDMQLVGKVVFSATALLILGLAYRFYKSRLLDRGDLAEDGAGCTTREEGPTLVTQKCSHIDGGSATLRHRHVNNNLNSSIHGHPDSEHGPTNGLEVLLEAQEESGTLQGQTKENSIRNVSCEHQEELKNVNNNLKSSKDGHLDSKHGPSKGLEVLLETQEESGSLQGEATENNTNVSCTLQEELRNVDNNIKITVDKAPASKNETSEVLDTGTLPLETKTVSEGHQGQTRGNNSKDVTCDHKEELKNVEVEKIQGIPDPLQGLCPSIDLDRSNEEHCESNGSTSGSTTETYRQDPEGKEMHGNVDMFKEREFLRQTTKNVTVSSAIDLSIQQGNDEVQGVHKFSSVAEVKVEENIIRDRQDTSPGQEKGHLRGKIYSYLVESTSHSVTTDRNYKSGAAPSLSSQRHLKRDREVEEDYKMGVSGQSKDVGDGTLDMNLDQEDPPLKLNHLTNTQDILGARSDCLDYTPSVTALTPSSLDICDNTFHVSLSPGSTFDVHLNVDNCYDVLCLAKKHNLVIIKTAAYKLMSNNFLEVLQNPAVYGRLNAAERDLILDNRMKGRRVVVVADVDSQVYSMSQNHSRLSYYDGDNDLWFPLSQIPVDAVSRGCAMTTMFNYLFVILGCEGPGRQMKPSRRVFCYNPLTGTWREIAPLHEARPHCKLVALDGYLYAIGGECLHTVERYDSRQNRWSYVAPLPNDTFAVAHMATVCEDGIYVTGGTIRYMLLRYHQKENMWTTTLISGSKDRTTEMVAANNFLYRFDLNRSMGISVHRCSIRARIWYECASHGLPYPASFQCAVIDNNIYCISRSFHLRFLADDISPRFIDGHLQLPPLPKGVLFPFVLVLPDKDSQNIG
ncbi:kelch domain-containing protein 7A [Discoglossus pictus]